MDLSAALETSQGDLQKAKESAKKQIKELEEIQKRASEAAISFDVDGETVKSLEQLNRFMTSSGRSLANPQITTALAKDTKIRSRGGMSLDDVLQALRALTLERSLCSMRSTAKRLSEGWSIGITRRLRAEPRGLQHIWSCLPRPCIGPSLNPK